MMHVASGQVCRKPVRLCLLNVYILHGTPFNNGISRFGLGILQLFLSKITDRSYFIGNKNEKTQITRGALSKMNLRKHDNDPEKEKFVNDRDLASQLGVSLHLETGGGFQYVCRFLGSYLSHHPFFRNRYWVASG